MRIALATTDFLGLIKNGGVGTSTYLIAKTLVEQKHEVHVYFCHSHRSEQLFNFIFFRDHYLSEGIRLHELRSLDLRIENGYLAPTTSFLLYTELKSQKFDQIYFTDLGGIGYYSFLAQQQGLAFQNCKLAMIFHGPTSWHYMFNNAVPEKYKEVVNEAVERLACQNAPEIIFATNFAAQRAQQLGYLGRDSRSYICMYPFAAPLPRQAAISKSAAREFVFFGRLEERKGIIVFLESLLKLKTLVRSGFVKITFLGSSRHINGRPSTEFLKDWSETHGIPITVNTGLDTSAALDFIKKRNATAVLASTEETLGYTLAECAINGISFVCSDIDAYSEVVDHLQLKNCRKFKSGDPQALADAIRSCLAEKNLKVAQVSYPKIAKTQASNWAALVKKIKQRPRVKSLKAKPLIKLSVAIVCTERANQRHISYLQELIQSLIQVISHFDEIVILVNGLTKHDCLQIEKIAKISDKISVIQSKKKLAASFAKNRVAAKCTSPYILFIDDDNILNSQAFKKCHESLSVGVWDVAICPLRIVDENGRDMNSMRIFVNNEPGLNLIDNLAGDGNFIVRKKSFFALGGFNSAGFAEDQDFLFRAYLKRLKYRMVPESFVKYRKHSASITSQANRLHNMKQLSGALSEAISGNESLSTFLNYLRAKFEAEDETASETPVIDQFYQNLPAEITYSEGSERLFHSAFSNKLIKRKSIFYINFRQSSNLSQPSPVKRKVTLQLYSTRHTVLSTDQNNQIELVAGANKVDFEIPANVSLKLFSSSQEAKVSLQSINYAQD